ncbi:MAG: hypothetical protein SOY99_08725 [Alloprevotella sp.]|nr:hypothetical protein [Bacteroidales bacterium]MDY3944292.1 hypothetical protein [Alloprevotella sp.]
MTKDEATLLHRLETQVRLLLQRYKELEVLCHTLQTEKVQLQQQLADTQKESAQLREDLSKLKMAKILEVTDTDVKDTRNRVNKLIREVDKCIALLNI